jgi:hypothetical protein
MSKNDTKVKDLMVSAHKETGRNDVLKLVHILNENYLQNVKYSFDRL